MSRWIGGLALMAMLLLAACAPQARLETLWDAPSFSLVAENGQAFGTADLKGRVWLVDFIYTTCPDECPIYLSPKMAALQREVLTRGWQDRVQLISFTVDPQRDTSAVLAAYAARYNADARVWRFVTGLPVEINRLLETGFRVGTAIPAQEVSVATDGSGQHMQGTAATPPAAGSYTLLHTPYFLLVDRQGKIRGHYDGEQVEVKEMLGAISALAQAR